MASIIVSFPSETLEIGKALERVRNSEGFAYVPAIADRFEWYLLLKNSKAIVEPLLAGIKDRYNAEIDGTWVGDDWIGAIDLGMENIREFPVYNLAWKLEGNLTGVFLRFSGNTGIMRLESDRSLRELEGICEEYQSMLSAEWKVACVETPGPTEQWNDLVQLAKARQLA